MAQLMADNTSHPNNSLPHETLSDREYQILCMIAEGKRIKDIAENLGLSPKSVSRYRTRLLEKLKLKNNEQLISYARQHDLPDS